MRGPAPEASRWRVAGVIAWREARAVLRGIGACVALTLALVAAAWVLLIDVRALAAAGLLVLADPFRSPLAIATLVLAAFLALSAALSTARDRESGTLEVLFYAPVDEITCVLGKVGGLLVVYLAALPILFAAFALLALITGFALSPAILVSLALSVVPAAAVVSFGVLLSIGADRVRTAVLLLVGATAVLLGAALAYGMVLLVPIADPSSPVLALRDALAALDAIVRWISPFAWLERVVDGALSGAWRTALIGLGAGVGGTLLMMAGAAYCLRRRGVYRRSE